MIQPSLSAKYKTEEIESFHTIDEAFLVLAPYLNNPFDSLVVYNRKRHHFLNLIKRE
jgi:hypothetical protein